MAEMQKQLRTPAASGLLLVCLSISIGCAAPRAAKVRLSSGLGWPPGRPEIVLDQVIELDPGGRPAPPGPAGSFAESEIWFLRPYGVALDEESILVADPGTGVVSRIDARGRAIFSPPGLFVQPIGVAACPRGIVVSDPGAGRVALLGGDLRLSRWLAEDLQRPTGVLCEGQNVLVAETGRHRVLVFDATGERESFGTRGEGPGEFNFPTSLALSRDGILVGDTLNFRVQLLARGTGAHLRSFGWLGDAPGEMPRIKGIAVDRAGHIWVSDAHLDRVSVYGPDGDLLVSIGGRGGGDAEFSFPAGIAAHADGRVVVADSLNRRLQVFRATQAALPLEGPDPGESR